ncbi:hypothetical protein VPHD479_0113 [Vibrio phage D479]
MIIENAAEAREFAEYQQRFRLCVADALKTITEAAMRGEFRCKFMHPRCYTDSETTSKIADELRARNFVVDSSDDLDFKGNNYRTIMVEW